MTANRPILNLLIIQSPHPEQALDEAALAANDIVTHCIELECLPGMASVHCDVALLLARPRRDNLAALGHLFATAPTCKTVIVMTTPGAEALAYLQAGATGLLSSLPDASRLSEILRRVYHGDYFLDQDIAQVLAMRQIKKLLEPFTALSSREFDVFCLLAEEYGLQEIAEHLDISSKTVSNCQTQIKLKLGLDNREALKIHAKNHGLIRQKGL